jgi:hypothetical protein
MSANQSALGSNITLFEIYSNYDDKKSLDISGGCTELSYYESLLDNTVRVRGSFIDTGFRTEESSSGASKSVLEKGDVQLTAGEKVHFVMEDYYGQKLVLKDDYQLRIKEVRNIIEHTQSLGFTIDFYSKESIDNEFVETRVTKKYDGKIPDSVRQILTNVLKTPKNIEVDDGLNSFSFLGHVEKPLYKCAWLAKRCVPEMSDANGNYAGYFFYEIGDDGTGTGGYKFKSIDKLFTQSPKRKLIYNNTTILPEEYDAKILNYSFINSVDIHKQLVSGGLYSTQLRSFSTYDNGYGENLFSYDKQVNEDNNAGKEKIKLPFQDKATRISTKILSPGVVKDGNNFDQSKLLNLDTDKIVRQSFMRYNNLFSTRLTITIAGDFGLHAGDLVYCDFPEVADTSTQEVSSRKGGIYMIVDLCHLVTSRSTFTQLNLVRDTIGRKPF